MELKNMLEEILVEQKLEEQTSSDNANKQSYALEVFPEGGDNYSVSVQNLSSNEPAKIITRAEFGGANKIEQDFILYMAKAAFTISQRYGLHYKDMPPVDMKVENGMVTSVGGFKINLPLRTWPKWYANFTREQIRSEAEAERAAAAAEEAKTAEALGNQTVAQPA